MQDLENYLDIAIESQQRLLDSLATEELDFDARARRDRALQAIRLRGVTGAESEALRDKIDRVVRLERRVFERLQTERQRINHELNSYRQRRKMAGVYASA